MRGLFHFYLYRHGMEVSECKASMLCRVSILSTLLGIPWKDLKGAMWKMPPHVPSTCLCEDVVCNIGCQ